MSDPRYAHAFEPNRRGTCKRLVGDAHCGLREDAAVHRRWQTRESLETQPTEITPALLSVVVMPNGEVICLGKTVGWYKELKPYLVEDRR